uniref:CC172 protein n=1 Tax=Anisakis simplex TaxID=6269 RepID=A0A0M3JBW8_ANISI
LTSAKELLRSQEEALKKREEERSALKQKLIANELETRGKEAQIRHLNTRWMPPIHPPTHLGEFQERVKNLRGELENCQNENRQLKEKEEQMDVNKIVLESKIRDYDSETQKINVLMENFETERQKLNESVKKLASELMTSQSENSDLKDDLERAKKELAKFERSEVNLRRSLDEQMRNVKECQNLRDRVGRFDVISEF